MRREVGHIFHDRSGSWTWDGVERWWEIESRVMGYGGRFGYWVTKSWKWNNSSQVMFKEIQSLTPEQSDALDEKEDAETAKNPGKAGE